MARPEDLVVFKTIAGRPRDIEDASALLVLYPKLDRDRIRDRVKQLAALADQPELASGLDTAIEIATKTTLEVRRPSTRAAKTKPRRRGR
jgi:hypothetical protein